MFTSSPARWLAALPALAAMAALAQPADTSPTSRTATATPSLPFRSAMDGYKPFTDEKAIPWPQANETVHQRGGWRAYANEAAGTSPNAPAGESNPYAGHALPLAAPPKGKP